jgi:hypothetical protein
VGKMSQLDTLTEVSMEILCRVVSRHTLPLAYPKSPLHSKKNLNKKKKKKKKKKLRKTKKKIKMSVMQISKKKMGIKLMSSNPRQL